MPMTVRPLNVADREAWSPLWQGYLELYKTGLAPEITDVTWSHLLDSVEDMHCLIAGNESGEMIDIVHYLYHRVTCAVADSGRPCRGDARGADQVYWLTQDFNTDGWRLYDRVGRVAPFIRCQR